MDESAVNLDVKFSPSRILDEMFYGKTSPDVIVAYLQQYEESGNELSSLADNSDCFERIFQIDFLLNLSRKQQHWLLAKLSEVDRGLVQDLCWQVCSDKSPADIGLRQMLLKQNQLLSTISSRKLLKRHPYSSSTVSRSGKALDSEIFSRLGFFTDVSDCVDDIISSSIGHKHNAVMDWLLVTPFSTLFLRRIFQEDVFKSLPIPEMYRLVHNIQYIPFDIGYKFIRQVLQSDELSIEVKREVVNVYRSYLSTNANTNMILRKACKGRDVNIDKLLRNIYKTRSFSMLYVDAAATGQDWNSHLAMLLLFGKKTTLMLQEWLELDKESLLKELDLEEVIRENL